MRIDLIPILQKMVEPNTIKDIKALIKLLIELDRIHQKSVTNAKAYEEHKKLVRKLEKLPKRELRKVLRGKK